MIRPDGKRLRGEGGRKGRLGEIKVGEITVEDVKEKIGWKRFGDRE
jgi:hypothetical protein